MNTKKMDGDSGTNFIINYLKAMLRNTCFNYVQFFLIQIKELQCGWHPDLKPSWCSLRVPIPMSEGKCQSLFQLPDQTLSFKTTW